MNVYFTREPISPVFTSVYTFSFSAEGARFHTSRFLATNPHGDIDMTRDQLDERVERMERGNTTEQQFIQFLAGFILAPKNRN